MIPRQVTIPAVTSFSGLARTGCCQGLTTRLLQARDAANGGPCLRQWQASGRPRGPKIGSQQTCKSQHCRHSVRGQRLPGHISTAFAYSAPRRLDCRLLPRLPPNNRRPPRRAFHFRPRWHCKIPTLARRDATESRFNKNQARQPAW